MAPEGAFNAGLRVFGSGGGVKGGGVNGAVMDSVSLDI